MVDIQGTALIITLTHPTLLHKDMQQLLGGTTLIVIGKAIRLCESSMSMSILPQSSSLDDRVR